MPFKFNWHNRGVVAILLLSAVLFFVMVPLPLLWDVVTFILAAAAAYEWGRICGFHRNDNLLYVGLFVLFALLATILGKLVDGNNALYSAYFGFIALFWISIAPWWVLKGWAITWSLSAALGLLVLYAAWLSASVLYDLHMNLLLAGLVLVWVFDTACYVVGRLIGSTPLAPKVSPKKTVEGLLGGLMAVFIGGILYNHYFSDETVSIAILLSAVFSLSILAALGDLFVSALKRRAGVKDSGRAFGNHGGVLDRMDSLLSVLPLVALLSPWLA